MNFLYEKAGFVSEGYLFIGELEKLYGSKNKPDDAGQDGEAVINATLLCRLKEYMTIVTGFSKLMISHTNPGDKLYSYALQISKSAEQINKLIAEEEARGRSDLMREL